MKIGYLRLDHGEWAQGAYNSQELGLAKAFEKLGHDVTIFYCVFPTDEKAGKTINITRHIQKSYLPAPRFGHHALLNPKELDRYPLDLLHIQGDNLMRVPDMVKYCKEKGLKCYCYVGRIDSEKTGKVHRLLADLMVQRNLKAYRTIPVFAKTPAVKNELRKHGVTEAVVAPVGLDFTVIPDITQNVKELREELKLPREKTVITCVCRLVPGKRPYDIFELAKLLDDSCYYVFIGGWDHAAEEAFLQRVTKERLGARFRYISKIPNAEIHKYYRSTDYIVNFNQHEIFGMAIMEAMYQEATVIARRAPGPEYTIEHGTSGYLVDTLKEMSQVIQSKRKVGGEARRRVIEMFSWDITAGIMLGEVFCNESKI